MKATIERLQEIAPAVPGPLLPAINMTILALRKADKRITDLEDQLYNSTKPAVEGKRKDDSRGKGTTRTPNTGTKGKDVQPTLRVPKDNSDNPPEPVTKTD